MAAAIQRSACNLYANSVGTVIDLATAVFCGRIAVHRIQFIYETAMVAIRECPSFTATPIGWFQLIQVVNQNAFWSPLIGSAFLDMTKIAIGSLWTCATSAPVQQFERFGVSIEQLSNLVQKAEAGDEGHSISTTCGQICRALIEYNKAPLINVNEITQLSELRNRMAEVIEKVAEQKDPEEDIQHASFFRLSQLGFRVSDFQRITHELGFDRNQYPFLEMKLAEKGLYTLQDLKDRGIVEGSIEFMISRVIYELASDEQQAQMHRPEIADFRVTLWQKTVRHLYRADEIAARVFAVAFNMLSFYVAAITLHTITPIGAIICVWIGHLLSSSKFYYWFSARPSDFCERDIFGRIQWLFSACNPWRNFFMSIGRGLCSQNMMRTLVYDFWG